MIKLRIVFFLASAAVGAAAACGGSGNTDELMSSSGGSSSGGSSTSSASSGGSSTSSASSGGSSTSSASSGGSDAGDGGGSSGDGGGDGGDAGPTTAFTGAPAFVDMTGPTTIKSAHPFAGNNPVKQACLTCHKTGGSGPKFSFGGSVFKDAAGTMPATNIEVRVRDSVGNAILVHTDANGNFYSTTNFTFPAKTGVRNATTTTLMVADAANGDCNSCHNGTTQAFIHIP